MKVSGNWKVNYIVRYEDERTIYEDGYKKKKHAKEYYLEAIEEGYKNVKIIKKRRK
jgi:hypothetical protein